MSDVAQSPGKLKRALEAVRAKDPDLTVQKIAKLAGVASAAVIAVNKGEWPGKGKSAKRKTQRQEVGWAETLARLAVFVNRRLVGDDPFEIDDALRDFGLDPESPAIALAVKAILSQSGSEGLATDSVLRQIALRKNAVNIGVLRWPPFFKHGEADKNSWAWRYSSRLVASINPIDWHLEPIVEDSFDEAVSHLGAGSAELDLVFGVYDTPYRRLRGVDFINIPGLAVPLGLISNKADQVEGSLWKTIIDPHAVSRQDMVIIILTGEVGHLFLLGPCQFPADQLGSADYDKNSKPEDMVRIFGEYVSANPDRTVLICADQAFCRSVDDAARRLVGSSDPQLKSLATTLRVLEPDPVLTPKYRLGLGVRADADRWSALLREAQVSELFGNALGQTAAEYVSLLLESKTEIALIPLVPTLDLTCAGSFSKQCRRLLVERRADASFKHRHNRIDEIYNEIRNVWEDRPGKWEWRDNKYRPPSSDSEKD